MGIADNQHMEHKGRKASIRKHEVKRGTSEKADWASVEAKAISAAIQAVAYQGGALRFGYTSDGGAYALGIYGDGEPKTEYFRPDEDVTGYLYALTEAWG